MFASWGRALAAHRRLVVIASVISLVLAIFTMVTVAPDLSADGFVTEDAESSRVDEQLATEFGRGSDSIVFLFDATAPVSEPSVRTAVEAALAPVTSDERFGAVLTTWSTGNPDMVANSGTSTYAVAVVDSKHDVEDAEVESLVERIEESAHSNGLEVTTGGGLAVGIAIAQEVEQGIIRAETFSVPLTILIQVVVFGSLVAAGVPLLIGALAIVASIGLIFVLSTDIFQSIFAVNIITMLGLGLGIDYSLFMVTRFREEIAHRSTADALAVTMATVGKAILFSGITVIFGLGATQFFPLPALQSMGQAGMIVTAVALVYGLTLLPAILAMLGTRINSLQIGRRRNGQTANGIGLWHSIATAVMRYPAQVLVVVLVVLIGAGLPLLRLDLTPGGPEVLPAGLPARTVSERLVSDFPSVDAEPIPVLATLTDGTATSPESVAALQALESRLTAIPGVTRVRSFASNEIATEAGFDWKTYAGDPATLPA